MFAIEVECIMVKRRCKGIYSYFSKDIFLLTYAFTGFNTLKMIKNSFNESAVSAYFKNRQRMIDTYHNNPEYIDFRISQTAHSEPDPREAFALLESRINLTWGCPAGPDPFLLFQAAKILYDRNEEHATIKAKTYLKKALDSNPNDTHTLQLLGDVYDRLGYPLKAIHHYQLCACSDQKTAILYGKISTLYTKLKLFDKALEAAEESIRLDPKNPAAWGQKAVALTGLERFNEALEAAAEGIRLDPKNPAAWGQKALISFYLGQDNIVDHCLDQLDQIDPSHTYRAYLEWVRQEGLDEQFGIVEADWSFVPD